MILMNLFGKKLSSKSPPRKSISLNSLKRNSEKSPEEIASEFDKIRINFGSHKAKFKNGEWITDNEKGAASSDNLINLKKKLKETEDENNLLKLKVEILLDMLTEKSAENLLIEQELSKRRR